MQQDSSIIYFWSNSKIVKTFLLLILESFYKYLKLKDEEEKYQQFFCKFDRNKYSQGLCPIK